MSQLATVRNYKAGLTPSQSQLDSAFNSVESFFNTTGISTSNILDSSITTSKLVSQAVTGQQLFPGSVTSLVLQSDGALNINRAVTTNSLRDSSITASKIPSGAITFPTLFSKGSTSGTALVGQVATSGSSGGFGVTLSSAGSVGPSTVSNLTPTLWTRGNPVLIILGLDGSNSAHFGTGLPMTNSASFPLYHSGSISTFSVGLYRNGTLITTLANSAWGGSFSNTFIDTPPTSTISPYTYTVCLSASSSSSGTLWLSWATLTAFELN